MEKSKYKLCNSISVLYVENSLNTSGRMHLLGASQQQLHWLSHVENLNPSGRIYLPGDEGGHLIKIAFEIQKVLYAFEILKVL